MTVKDVPEGYHTVTPYLIVKDAAGLIDFLQKVFSAQEIERMQASSGRIMHAEVRIGDSVIMMGESSDGSPSFPAMLYLYLEDCDAAYQRALSAGATSLQEPKDEFYGDRTAAVQDAFGNQWWIATRVRDVPDEEIERKMKIEVSRGQAPASLRLK